MVPKSAICVLTTTASLLHTALAPRAARAHSAASPDTYQPSSCPRQAVVTFAFLCGLELFTQNVHEVTIGGRQLTFTERLFSMSTRHVHWTSMVCTMACRGVHSGHVHWWTWTFSVNV